MNSDGSKPIFLYVEDDTDSRVVLETLLTLVMGYSDITMFETSENFMDSLNALSDIPTVIFLDVQMSPLNGYDMLGLLRSDERYREATVIATTANVMSHDVDDLKEAGFDGLIGKPIIDEVFPELVVRILDGESVWFVP